MRLTFLPVTTCRKFQLYYDTVPVAGVQKTHNLCMHGTSFTTSELARFRSEPCTITICTGFETRKNVIKKNKDDGRASVTVFLGLQRLPYPCMNDRST